MSGEKVVKWRENVKKLLVDLMGGCCNKCGYSRCMDALDLHHLDHSEKEFQISKAIASPKALDKILKEAKKCVLLCAVCHRELHAGLWDITTIRIVQWETPKPKVIKKYLVTGICFVCGKEVTCNKITCSRICAAKRKAKIIWPTNNELQQLFRQYNNCEIARLLGVSEMAVRKRKIKIGGSQGAGLAS